MIRSALTLVALTSAAALAQPLHVDPEAGNNTFTAVFDAALGERITANSAAVGCELTLDAKAGVISGTCAAPLAQVRVDNDDTKTAHFWEWATNKATKVDGCSLEARFEEVKVGSLTPGVPRRFSASVSFTVCGRGRADGGRELVTGRVVLIPPDAPDAPQTLRAHATIQSFRRSLYRVGPEFTDGWLSRVQRLAKVVADDGTIELTLFARPVTK